MKRKDCIVVLTIAVLAVSACLVAIAQDGGEQAIPEDSEFQGSKLCGMCHKDEMTAYEETAHFTHEPPADTDEPWKHNTGWDADAGEAAEEGIRCETCHGRGSAHSKAKTEEKYPLVINSLNIENNASRVSICAQCHARYTAKEGDLPVDYTPGENLLEKIDLLPVEEGATHQQVNELVTSTHFEKNVGCVQCHTSHSGGGENNLREPAEEICKPCHADQLDMAHTKGMAKEGDTCVGCHMPNGAHTFAKPAGE
ncbi:MAG TPA: cytochrome c3 family protein [Armatimonadota bacterium]|nr:cytochrome c3 family protein [Armatimonadota bacterium]